MCNANSFVLGLNSDRRVYFRQRYPLCHSKICTEDRQTEIKNTVRRYREKQRKIQSKNRRVVRGRKAKYGERERRHNLPWRRKCMERERADKQWKMWAEWNLRVKVLIIVNKSVLFVWHKNRWNDSCCRGKRHGKFKAKLTPKNKLYYNKPILFSLHAILTQQKLHIVATVLLAQYH